jgi:acyl dehydratase
MFLGPVKIGDEITARVAVLEIIEERCFRMRTQCFNQRSDLVLAGKVVIAVPKRGHRKASE